MKNTKEFEVGKHNIRWISSDFRRHFPDGTEFAEKPLGVFQKLPRSMNDAAIESELAPGLCELGDVLAFLDQAPEECKDGNFNLFYTKDCVVGVYWSSFDGEWSVVAWRRRGVVWGRGGRVFSPATRSSVPQSSAAVALGPSEPRYLEERVRELEEWKKRVIAAINN